MISGLVGAVEADRKERRVSVDRYNRKIANSRICQGSDSGIPKERGYEVAYSEIIKGSIEEELADTVIRLLDLTGLRGINLKPTNGGIDDCIEGMTETCEDETFTGSICSISILPIRYDEIFDLSTATNNMILPIFGLAKHLDIDLLWHIEQKMKYSKLRKKIHGKKY